MKRKKCLGFLYVRRPFVQIIIIQNRTDEKRQKKSFLKWNDVDSWSGCMVKIKLQCGICGNIVGNTKFFPPFFYLDSLSWRRANVKFAFNCLCTGEIENDCMDSPCF